MPAIKENIQLERGVDYEVEEYILDDFGNPLDISGDTFIGAVFDRCGGNKLADFVYAKFLDPVDSIWKYTRFMARATITGLPESPTQLYWEQFQISPANLSTKNFEGEATVACKGSTIPA